MAAWRIVRTDEALRVEHPSRAPVLVTVDGWRFVLASDGRDLGRFPCQDVRAVGRRVVEVLRRGARPSPYTLVLSPAAVPHPLVVAGHLLAERTRLLAGVDPRVRALWDRIAALTPTMPQLLCCESLYRDELLLRDVMTYRAAAVALAFVETTLRPADFHWDATTPAGEAALLAVLRRWRGLFAPDGRSYRSLDRTLMRLPPAVPPDLLCELRTLRLPRPLADGLELTAVLLAQRIYRRAADPTVAATHLHALVHARPGEIAGAVARVGAAMGRTLRPSRRDDLEVALRFVADYPDPCRGRLPGLIERAVRWHRVEPDVRCEVQTLGGSATPTARPPIPLPDEPGITFLDTLDAVVSEGQRMGHCVGTYARAAAGGACYLFHVEHGGAAATVEVDTDGTVRQACGPHNQTNAATRWGRRRLAAWGEALAPEPVRRRRALAAEVRRRRRRRAVEPPPEQLALWPAPA